jgi:hypothetical protein
MPRANRYLLPGYPCHLTRVLELTECSNPDELARKYSAFVEEAIKDERLSREAQWTESIAVGSREFVEEVAEQIEGRVHLDINEAGEDTWTVREVAPPYGLASGEGA